MALQKYYIDKGMEGFGNERLIRLVNKMVSC